MASRAGAEEYWGRRFADPPRHFIFGYGSLINAASRNSTAEEDVAAIPARVSAAFGHVRAWAGRGGGSFTPLGLRRPLAGERAMSINGVIYPARGNDLDRFDRRERSYVRMAVPREMIEPAGWQPLPQDAAFWIYVSMGAFAEIGENLRGPTADSPIVQSYLDVVLSGALAYGADYAREVVATTAGWNGFWLDDRPVPRRPWAETRDAMRIDAILRETPPAADLFGERLYPEQYGVRHLLPAHVPAPGAPASPSRLPAPAGPE